MGRRTVLLVAALVVAALGTTLVFLYVNGVERPGASPSRAGRGAGREEADPGGHDRRGRRATRPRSSCKTISRGRRRRRAPLERTTPIAGQGRADRRSSRASRSSRSSSATRRDQRARRSPRQARRQRPARRPRAGRRLRRRRAPNVAIFLDRGRWRTAAAGTQTRLLLPEVQVIAVGNADRCAQRRPRRTERRNVRCRRPSSRSRSTRRTPAGHLRLSTHGKLYFGAARHGRQGRHRPSPATNESEPVQPLT